MTSTEQRLEGGCTCGQVRYKMTRPPMIVHCCHCRWCQRQTGASFALNALVEAQYVDLAGEGIENISVPSPSGKGQQIARCPTCKVAVWSNYYMGGLFERVRFIRVGTLDNPDQLPPDVHIYTEDKQSWVLLPPDTQAVSQYYDTGATWSAQSIERLEKLQASL